MFDIVHVGMDISFIVLQPTKWHANQAFLPCYSVLWECPRIRENLINMIKVSVKNSETVKTFLETVRILAHSAKQVYVTVSTLWI